MRQLIAKMKLEHVYVIFMIFFGTILCFLTPPYQMGDEVVHFGRAWQISEGILFSPSATAGEVLHATGNGATQAYVQWGTDKRGLPPHVEVGKMLVAEVPSSMVPMEILKDYEQRAQQHAFSRDMIVRFLHMPFWAEPRETMLIPNAGSYSPLVYAPQAVAAWIGRMAGCSAGVIYYLMRLSAMTFVTGCIFASMKFLPEKKTIIFLLALMPMFLGEATAISADTVVYGICFLGTAWLLSLRKDSFPITKYELAGLVCLAIALGLMKQVYGIILLLYFLVPWQRLGSRRNFWMLGGTLLALSLLSSIFWIQLSVAGHGTELLAATWLGANIVAQKAFVMAHPKEYIGVLAHSVWLEKTEHAKAFIGWLGLNMFLMPKWFNWTYAIILTIGAFCGDMRLKWTHRLSMMGAFLITVAVLFTVEYIIWTPVGSDRIIGIQGRYFIPIALLLFCSFSCAPPFKHEKLFSVAAGLFSIATTIWVTYVSFYGG